MKIFKTLASMTAVVLTVAGMSSCTSEEPIVSSGKTDAISILKAPKVIAYSGDHEWGKGGRAQSKVISRAGTHYTEKVADYPIDKSGWNENMQQQHPDMFEAWEYAPKTTDRGEFVSTEEYNFVMQYIREHPDEGGLMADLDKYFIQYVGSSHDRYDLEFIMDNGQINHTANEDGGSHIDYIEYDGEHLRDYNANYGPRRYMSDWEIKDIYYHESYGDHTYDAYRFYYIELPWGEVACYLCFDYHTDKYDNGTCHYEGDGVYNDYVIKIIPGNGTKYEPKTGRVVGGEVTQPDPTEPDQPTEPDPVETCPDCGHEKHPDGECPKCGDNEDCNHKDETPGTEPSNPGTDPTEPEQPENPSTPDKPAVNNEVEVNLSASDKNGEYLESHLSIHVRHATDVDIFIPVDERFTCQEDDMAIVQQHFDNLLVHGGELDIDGYAELSYDINGNIVTLKIQIGVDGIHIWTEGINEAVIEYCSETYGDGITFEIWNYYNNGLDKESLKEKLNQSVIKFVNSCPDAYVNAFNKNDDGSKFADDCTVNIDPTQSDNFEAPVEGEHRNASPYNKIYHRKSAPAPRPDVPVY